MTPTRRSSSGTTNPIAPTLSPTPSLLHPPQVKLWHYDEGSQYFEGSGHSGSIVMAKVSPDEQRVVTVGSEGGIFLWKVPEIFANAERH